MEHLDRLYASPPLRDDCFEVIILDDTYQDAFIAVFDVGWSITDAVKDAHSRCLHRNPSTTYLKVGSQLLKFSGDERAVGEGS